MPTGKRRHAKNAASTTPQPDATPVLQEHFLVDLDTPQGSAPDERAPIHAYGSELALTFEPSHSPVLERIASPWGLDDDEIAPTHTRPPSDSLARTLRAAIPSTAFSPSPSPSPQPQAPQPPQPVSPSHSRRAVPIPSRSANTSYRSAESSLPTPSRSANTSRSPRGFSMQDGDARGPTEDFSARVPNAGTRISSEDFAAPSGFSSGAVQARTGGDDFRARTAMSPSPASPSSGGKRRSLIQPVDDFALDADPSSTHRGLGALSQLAALRATLEEEVVDLNDDDDDDDERNDARVDRRMSYGGATMMSGDVPDGVRWARWDEMRVGGVARRVLILAYTAGLQVWDCADLGGVRELLNVPPAAAQEMGLGRVAHAGRDLADTDNCCMTDMTENPTSDGIDGQLIGIGAVISLSSLYMCAVSNNYLRSQ